MKDDPSIPLAAAPGAAGPTSRTNAVADAVRHESRLAFLRRLAAAGMALLRGLVAGAEARAPGLSAPKRAGEGAATLADRFGYLAKAVRVAILLRRRLAEAGPGALPALGPAADPARACSDAPRYERETPERQTSTSQSYDRETPERGPSERSGDPWLDRSDEAEFKRRSLPALVRRLCAILEVTFDPALWGDGRAGRARAPAKATPSASGANLAPVRSAARRPSISGAAASSSPWPPAAPLAHSSG